MTETLETQSPELKEILDSLPFVVGGECPGSHGTMLFGPFEKSQVEMVLMLLSAMGMENIGAAVVLPPEALFSSEPEQE